MTRWAASALLSVTIAACADVQPRPYRIEGATKGVISADVRSIVVTAQQYLYGYAPLIPPRWPIFRIRFRSAAEAEVWYGNPNADQVDFLIFARRTDGWHHTGYGVELKPLKT
jgi:hypothetical protein